MHRVSEKLEKVGNSGGNSRFKEKVKQIIERDSLPSYKIRLDQSTKPNQLVFFTRDHRKLLSEAIKTNKIDWLNKLMQKPLANV